MAKKTRAAVKAKSVPSATPAPTPVLDPVPKSAAKSAPTEPSAQPAFWFGYTITWAKLAFARVLLFSMLAIDAFTQIGHAPRYGAGLFNVANLSILESFAPSRVGYEIGQLLVGYLLVLAALGVGTRLVIPLAAALYGWLYFGSQLDSYQHHYLMFLVIALASFVPWARPADATPATQIRSWALRLILCQLAVLYFWAAISKMDHAWIDGNTLGRQIAGGLRTLIDKTIGIKATSWLVIVTELTLAGTVWLKRAQPFAAPLGIAFHLGIVATKLEIGMFAYLMIAVYALVIPDGVYTAIARDVPWPEPFRRVFAALRERGSWIAWGLALVLGIVIASRVHLESSFLAGIVATLIPLALGIYALATKQAPRWAVAVVHVVAILLWVVLDHATSTAVDYYRFWGNSERKLGSPVVAEYAYRRLTEVAPDDENGHFQLARTLILDNKGDIALPELHTAQRLAPGKARAWLAEARFLMGTGKTKEALEAARAGVAAEPSSADARKLFNAIANASGLAAPMTGPAPTATPTKPAPTDDADQ